MVAKFKMPKIHWDRFLWINCVQLFVGTHGPYPTRLLCPWNFPGKNTRVVCLALLPTQGIFPTQGSNPHLQCLLYWIWILYLLSHWGSPIMCVCVCVCVYVYEGNGNPFQYSCLGNPVNRGAWWAAVSGVPKESDWTRGIKQNNYMYTCIS